MFLVANSSITGRAKIATQPSPSYTLRDIAHVLSGRVELLPAGESLAEHDTWLEQEKQKVELDRTQKGLFQGIFQKGRPMSRVANLHDRSDGVVRCPNCFWELEDGECAHCGFNASSGSSFETEGRSESTEWSDNSVGGIDMVPGQIDYRYFPASFENGYESFLDDNSMDEEGSIGSVENFIDDASIVAPTLDSDFREPMSPMSTISMVSDNSVSSSDSQSNHRETINSQPISRSRTQPGANRARPTQARGQIARPRPAVPVPRRVQRPRMIILSSDDDSSDSVVPNRRQRQSHRERVVSLTDSDENTPANRVSNAPSRPTSTAAPEATSSSHQRQRHTTLDRGNQGNQASSGVDERRLHPASGARSGATGNGVHDTSTREISAPSRRPPNPHPGAHPNGQRVRQLAEQPASHHVNTATGSTPAVGSTNGSRKAERKRERRERAIAGSAGPS